ncbi:MAG: glutamine-hydrolyzing GMP synthase [Clostridiaceae bacterium]|nr:glutamine-hydrolyzing GMP synthase [Clostridiaceae bacterium]
MPGVNFQKILILDCGSPYAQIIARRVRDLNVYSEVKPYTLALDKLQAENYQAVILIGSSYEKPNPQVQQKLTKAISDILTLELPVLAICLDDNLITADQAKNIYVSSEVPAFKQTDSEKQLLQDFLFNQAKLKGDWLIDNFIQNKVAEIKTEVGNSKVIMGLSGGVDSSVAAVLVHRAIGKQLYCIFVDHGLMRKNEGDQVEQMFRKQFDMNFIRVNAEDRFLGKLANVVDAEQKRKIIGEEFIRVFEEEAQKIENAEYLVQGTIYPDIIESGAGDSKLIKSHHNVGGLPEDIDFKGIIEPLADLFKDEVRRVGLALDIPADMIWRQPFPGPGLGIRIIGDITKAKADLLRDADAIYREEIAKAGLDRELSQYFAVLTNLKSVGVKDDARTYDYTLALRAVKTVDFMTAEPAEIPFALLRKITKRITDEVSGINRIVYDITGKPPATIEWE